MSSKEHPIRAYQHEVRAILEGRQTQIRRAINPQPQLCAGCQTCEFRCDHFVSPLPKSPYGKRGDKLYVRETWAALRISYDYESGCCDGWEETSPNNVKKYREEYPPHLLQSPTFDIAYADCYDNGADNVEERGFRWRPSIHMSRWASRIDLLVKDVRVERVQDISEGDAKAEGMESEEYLNHLEYVDAVAPKGIGAIWPSLRGEFQRLWDEINGPHQSSHGNPWDANPWVWVVGFERLIL